MVRLVEISKIVEPRRPVDEKTVRELAEDMCKRGMVDPIQLSGQTVWNGLHRLRAAKLLGWTHIGVAT